MILKSQVFFKVLKKYLDLPRVKFNTLYYKNNKMKLDKNSIVKIAKTTFKDKSINLSSNIDSVSNWDSINHVNFILEIEKKLKLKFLFEQSIAISSILDVIKILKKSK